MVDEAKPASDLFFSRPLLIEHLDILATRQEFQPSTYTKARRHGDAIRPHTGTQRAQRNLGVLVSL